MAPDMTTVLLVHGGPWEAGMDAEWFWAAPGIVAGLQRRGLQVLAPDRPVTRQMPVGVLPSASESPEPPRPEFPSQLEQFLTAVTQFIQEA